MPRLASVARLVALAAALSACLSCVPQSLRAPGPGRVARLAGTVMNERGEPVMGARVVAENSRATPHRFTAMTDEAGGFLLVGMDSGTWSFSASADGYAPSRAQVELKRGSPVLTIQLVLKVGTLAPSDRRKGVLAGLDVVRLQTELQNADTLMRAGHYDEAISAYREIVERTPSLTRVYLAIGDAWRMKKDHARALAAYRAELAADPGSEQAMVGIAAVEMEQGQLAAAETMLSEAASRPNPGAETLCALGDVKLAAQQPDQAAEWYRKAAQAAPRWARPILKLGQLAAARQDNQAAAALLQQAITLAPGSPEATEAARALAALRK